MKAIIPVAGAGTKLRPHTYTQPKALIPLAGKTLLAFIIDQLKEEGINDFIFIIGYLGEKIESYVKQEYPEINSIFIWQKDRNGIGEAIALTKETVANEDEILIIFGDTLAEYDLNKVLQSKVSCVGVKKVEDPKNFGIVEMDENNEIIKFIEKPIIPKSNIALVGIYKINEPKVLFECLEEVSVKNETIFAQFNLTDALDCMLQKNIKFETFKVDNWFDCGKKDALLECNAIMLKKSGHFISEDAIIENTIIIPPVSIAKGVNLKNSVIGPNISIGENSNLNYTIVKDTLIGSYSNLYQIVLNNSIIGSDSEVKGISRNLNIGDNTAIDLGGKEL